MSDSTSGVQQGAASNGGSSSGNPASKRRRLEHINEYKGYSLHKAIPLHDGESAQHCPVPIVQQDEATPEYLFRKFISKRRPCVISMLPSIGSSSGGRKLHIDKAQLVDVAGKETVQVERRMNSGETFGQNRSQERQLEITISSFCQKLCEEKDGELLYLSTQESSSDDAIFSTPCKQLLKAGAIDDTLAWAGDLSLQACNLWMGKSQTGTSSGLHHDFHDNFYLLIKGNKSFRLFSPDCAFDMKTYGEVERIHPNGLISYVGNETKADGTLISETSDDGSGEDEDDNEEAATFGKGFDYASDDDEEDFNGQDFEHGKDDFEEMVGAKEDNHEDETAQERPNNFSRIHLNGRSFTEAVKEFPSLSNQRECIVTLEPGQSLYLPAGWFHEVTSKSTSKDGEHIALNYWYKAPSD